LLPTPQGVKTLFAARGRLKLFIPQQTVLPEKIVEEARRWLQVPYREGGTTLLGWDASAYIQHIYRQQGILLPRKAEQILSAALIIRDLSQLKPGDLFFYQNQSGLYLGQQEILHPRPEQQRFVISSLNPADPRYDKTIRISFRHAARLLLGKGY
jgi:cell wall-associated NlpC family hydrolase